MKRAVAERMWGQPDARHAVEQEALLWFCRVQPEAGSGLPHRSLALHHPEGLDPAGMIEAAGRVLGVPVIRFSGSELALYPWKLESCYSALLRGRRHYEEGDRLGIIYIDGAEALDQSGRMPPEQLDLFLRGHHRIDLAWCNRRVTLCSSQLLVVGAFQNPAPLAGAPSPNAASTAEPASRSLTLARRQAGHRVETSLTMAEERHPSSPGGAASPGCSASFSQHAFLFPYAREELPVLLKLPGPRSPLHGYRESFRAGDCHLRTGKAAIAALVEAAEEEDPGNPAAGLLRVLPRVLDPELAEVAGDPGRWRRVILTPAAIAGAERPRLQLRRGAVQAKSLTWPSQAPRQDPLPPPPRPHRSLVAQSNSRLAREEDLRGILFPAGVPPDAPPGVTISGVVADVEASADGAELRRLPPADWHLGFRDLFRHTLITGKTGAGKNQRMVWPLLFSLLADSSAGIIYPDFQGTDREIVISAARMLRPGARVVLLAPDDPGISARLNPMDRCGELAARVVARAENADAELREEALRVANLLVGTVEVDPANESDGGKFFRGVARDWLCEVIEAVCLMAARGLGRYRPTLECVREAFRAGKRGLNELMVAGHREQIEVIIADLEHANGRTSLMEIMNTLAAVAGGGGAAQVTSSTDFDLNGLLDEGGILVIHVTQDRIRDLRPLTTLFFEHILAALARRPAETAPSAVFFLDELGTAIGPVPNLDIAANTLRKRNVALVACLQHLTQLDVIYGKEKARSIMAAFGTRIIIPPITLEDARLTSSETGLMTVDQPSVGPDGFSILSIHPMQRPLLEIDEILNPQEHPELGPRVLFGLPGVPPFQGYLPAALDSALFQQVTEEIARIELPSRDEQLRRNPPPARGRKPEGLPPGDEGLDLDTLPGQMFLAHRCLLGWSEANLPAREWWRTFEFDHPEVGRAYPRFIVWAQAAGLTVGALHDAWLRAHHDHHDTLSWEISQRFIFLLPPPLRIDLDSGELEAAGADYRDPSRSPARGRAQDPKQLDFMSIWKLENPNGKPSLLDQVEAAREAGEIAEAGDEEEPAEEPQDYGEL